LAFSRWGGFFADTVKGGLMFDIIQLKDFLYMPVVDHSLHGRKPEKQWLLPSKKRRIDTPEILNPPSLNVWLGLKDRDQLIQTIMQMTQALPQAAEFLAKARESDIIDTRKLIADLWGEAEAVMVKPEKEYGPFLVLPDYASILKEIDRLLPLGLGEQLLEWQSTSLSVFSR
jgi:hypothetical protein